MPTKQQTTEYRKSEKKTDDDVFSGVIAAFITSTFTLASTHFCRFFPQDRDDVVNVSISVGHGFWFQFICW